MLRAVRPQLVLVFALGLVACGSTGDDADTGAVDSEGSGSATSTATATDAPTTDASATDPTVPGDDDGSTGADDDATTDPGTATTPADDSGDDSTGEVPTGDVWVDANGDVIGLYRVVVDDDRDAIEGLVDADDVTWRVRPYHDELSGIDDFALVFYETDDCTGPRYFVEANPSYGSFDPDVLASGYAVGDEELFFFVPADAERVQPTLHSWYDFFYGCQSFESQDFVPGLLVAEDDVVSVTPPAFVPPLMIEHH